MRTGSWRPPSSGGGALDGAQDGEMRAAAAFEAGEPGTDLGIARMRIVGEERGRRHDPAIDAVAALRHLLVDPGLLELMRLLRRAEPGERRDLAAGRRRDPGDAGADGAAVEMHGAGAALREAAAEMRVGEAEIAAQGLEQRHLGIGLDARRLTVEPEGNALRHGIFLLRWMPDDLGYGEKPRAGNMLARRDTGI